MLVQTSKVRYVSIWEMHFAQIWTNFTSLGKLKPVKKGLQRAYGSQISSTFSEHRNFSNE